MLVIRMAGGLGNQMFIYAFYMAQKKRGKKCVLEISSFRDDKLRDYELPYVFGIADKTIEYSKQRHWVNGILSRLHIRRKYYDSPIGFKSNYFKIENGEFWGLWQDEKYFIELKDELLKVFTFVQPLSEKEEKWLNEVRKNNSVSVSVRRTDMLGRKTNPSLEFYHNAIEFIKKSISNPEFYFVSDDLEWCKETFGNEYHYVDEGTHNSFDMRFISNCKHNIIASSTFAWWGAWLNKNSAKIVICSSRMLLSNSGIIPDNWTILDD